VNSTGSVNSLLEKSLVEIAGRKEAPGRPFLLQTTSHFLSTFGLHDLSELPELSPSDDMDFRDQLRGLVAEDMDVDDADLEQLEAEVAGVAEQLKYEENDDHDSTPEQQPGEEDEPR